MEMCKSDKILMELGITQLLFNYNSFLHHSEASTVTWLFFINVFNLTFLIAIDVVLE